MEVKMKFKWFLVLSCLAGAPMLAQAGETQPALTGAVYAGHAPDTASFTKVARARIFLGYDIYGHRIYAWHHVRRVLLGYNRYGRPIYGYIINNRPVFRSLYEYRMIVRPAHAGWNWGGRHWDRRWAGRWDRGEHRGWDRGEHRGWERGEHHGWDRGEHRAQVEDRQRDGRDAEHRGGDRHDRDQMHPRDEGARTGGQASGAWAHNRQTGGAAMGETHHRPDNGATTSSTTQGSAQAPAGSQTTQQQQERHHERRHHHDDSNNTTAAPPAGSSGTTSTGTAAPTAH
jgi:hypothetical protein